MDRLEEAVARVRACLERDQYCAATTVEDNDLRTILDALPEWRGIEEHDGSADPVLVLDDDGDCPLVGQFIGGEWLKGGDGDTFYPAPTRFCPIVLPPPPAQEMEG